MSCEVEMHQGFGTLVLSLGLEVVPITDNQNNEYIDLHPDYPLLKLKGLLCSLWMFVSVNKSEKSMP